MTSSMQRNLAPGLVTMVELDKPLVFSLNEETRRVWFVFFFRSLHATKIQRRNMTCSHPNSESRAFLTVSLAYILAS